jgi:AcrR family transcriptional regulator
LDNAGKKYASLLAAGRDLFWKHGFKRVTIDEICRKADVSKMTFYKYFPDKTELAKKVFDTIVSEGEIMFRKIMTEDSPATEKIQRMITMKLESTNNISPEFLQDFYSGSTELSRYVDERTARSWALLIADIRKAQIQGVFRKDFKPELIIKFQSKISELLEDESVTSLYKSRQELIFEFAKFMFYGIAPHE